MKIDRFFSVLAVSTMILGTFAPAIAADSVDLIKESKPKLDFKMPIKEEPVAEVKPEVKAPEQSAPEIKAVKPAKQVIHNHEHKHLSLLGANLAPEYILTSADLRLTCYEFKTRIEDLIAANAESKEREALDQSKSIFSDHSASEEEVSFRIANSQEIGRLRKFLRTHCK